MTTLPSPDLPDDPQTLELCDALYRSIALDQLLSRAPSNAAPRFDRRSDIVDALWQRAPFGPTDPRPIAEIAADELTMARFLDVSHGYHRPVVIRGFGAEGAAVKGWSAAGLAERVGPLPITAVEVDRRAAALVSAEGRTLHDMPLTDFVERMHHEPLYLHNSSDLITACPELLDDLELDRVRRTLCDPDGAWDPLFSASLFIGTGRVFSNLHNAPGGNFFLQVTGRKTWTFVEPGLTPYLMPLPSRPFNHARSAYGTFHTAEADCPIHRLPRYQVVLEPGDLLYNAPWWWHEVLNEGETIGCAMRHVTPPLERSPTWHNHRLFTALSAYPQLWAISLADYARNRVARRLGRGRDGSLRETVGRLSERTVNRARGRRSA